MASVVHFIQFVMEIRELILLLEAPEKLHSVVNEMRLRSDLSEEEKGFLMLYEECGGDTEKMLSYLRGTKEHILREQTSSLRFKWYWAAAVFILVLASGVFFLVNRKKTDSPEEAQASRSEIFKEPGVPIFMGEENKINWAPLMFAIDKETPNRALEEWKKIEKLNPDNDTLIYFGGIVFQELENFSKAKILFKKNMNSTSIFADRSAYFLFQLAKNEGNMADVKKLMERLKNTQDLDLRPFVLLEQGGKNKDQ